MAISANTTTPIKFLRRFSMPGPCPTYLFPAVGTSVVFRPGDAVVVDKTTGKAEKAAAVIAINTASNDAVMIGYFAGPSAGAPPFPSSAGVQGAFTNQASLTTNDPIPENEKVLVMLCLPDCVFQGHQTTNNGDITAPVRAPAASTGGILSRFSQIPATPTGENVRTVLDTNVIDAGNVTTIVLDYAYPQPIPSARSASGAADPYRVVLGASGTTNPAVEFICVGTMWNPIA